MAVAKHGAGLFVTLWAGLFLGCSTGPSTPTGGDPLAMSDGAPGDSAASGDGGDNTAGDSGTGDSAPGDAATDPNNAVSCGSAGWRNAGTTAVVPPPPAVDLGAENVPIRYPSGQVHSPINVHVANRIKAIAAIEPSRDASVFIKVGDSISDSDNFMKCVSRPLPFGRSEESYRDFGGRDLATTVQHYCGEVGGDTTYERESLAAQVGRQAPWAVAPDSGAMNQSPIEQEVNAMNPSVAIVMFGSNDIGDGGGSGGGLHQYKFDHFPAELMEVVDALEVLGVVPILTSIPIRNTSAGYQALSPSYREVIRGVAESRQIPFLDFQWTTAGLPSFGLGGDNLHPNSFSSGSCMLTAPALEFGYNARNLITLVALERVRRILVDDDTHLDASSAPLSVSGAGTTTSPFIVPDLPFTDVRDLKDAAESTLTSYTGACSTTRSGPENVYRLDLNETTSLRAFAGRHRGNTINFRIILMEDAASGANCVESHRSIVDTTLDAGTYYFSVDSSTVTGDVGSGEYMFGIIPCEPGDSTCD